MQLTISDFFSPSFNFLRLTSTFVENLQDLAKILNTNHYTVNVQPNPNENTQFPNIMNHIYIMDLNCNSTIKLLQLANKRFSCRVPNHWLVFATGENDILNDLNIFVDSHLVLAQKSNQTFVLKYVYKYSKTSGIIFDEFASWTFENGFLKLDIDSLSCRRHNIQQYTVRVSMLITDNTTYEHMDDYRQNEIDTPSKLNYILTNHLLDYMNASKKIIYHSEYYNIKSKNQNGTLIGSILNREIDLSGPFFCRPERLVFMDCLAMTTPAEGFFIFRQQPLSYVKNIYILPFGTELWLTDIAVLLVCAVFLYGVVEWEWKILKETDTEPEYDMIHATLSDSLLFTMGAVCNQGYATEPKGTPGKILILTIFVTLIFLFTAYSAYTVVLFQATANDIKTLKDLYDSDIALGIDDKQYFRQLFPKYTEPLRKKIYQEKIAPTGQSPRFYPLKEGIAKMRYEYFAFHVDGISGYKVIHDTFYENEKCELQLINYLFETNPWMISPKYVPFKKIFTVGYRIMAERGIGRREIERRMSHKPQCSGKGNTYRSAGLIDLYSVYMLLIIGVSSSIVILLLEILVHRLQKRSQVRSSTPTLNYNL